ncbi:MULTISPECIES: 6-phospho-3-hexuloisomerase [Rhodococcus]|uniref:6-phospho-3-hexuloisomerase n=1 Tax=Rhodococcus oxybenzonivorans TaxID=1990687 RepID=A0AAE5A8Y6_9NOCA|nr:MULTISPECIES: 6-phospho-3-hexuloisomerase [Rhodococcus]MDV7242038.1 6-phospho-3-hexuloisomerase [Rhodococcus oxybenzonivorans]MDV7268505.1 6-phospho-3-hexuloisomerase [Rhodococcus oxybenzonivorans]MDV7278376.1 6-phospho-3-hexuloisomerase [Rhodococcus oxybenzonivorans]MDV7337895.1 6-phospho-3-hexuloisomerase [Rhodococcus oxybenzonivorans]MDV7343738.1 6-phospho-3-hexuloisomerase [Rhodococcus oxybenzonivorans]
MTVTVEQTRTRFSDGRRIVLDENERLLNSVAAEQWDRAGLLITSARAVFVIGNGRSGLAVQMAAMRLMHLGLRVHVAGEVTAPAIGAGDVLIAVSGSGTTASVVGAADTAKKVGASILAVTTASDSPLARRADEVLVLPAADKQDHSATITRQYAGSLFEQSVLLAFDALFQALWDNEDQTAERLWERHANIG